MESSTKGKSRKKHFLIRTWDLYRPFQRSGKKKATREGYFPVYVGPEKQWFAVKTKYANHPLFRMLLEDTETEYGYNTPGPILLPCEVDLFFKVVAELEGNEMEPPGFGFKYGFCGPFNPSRRLVNAGGDQLGKGYGGYGLLKPAQLVMMN